MGLEQPEEIGGAGQPAPASATKLLLIPGSGTAATYLICSVFYGTIGRIPHSHVRNIFIWPALLILTALYLSGLSSLKRNQASDFTLVVAAWGAVFSLIAFTITPFRWSDLDTYINLGWLQYHYHLNPYVTLVGHIRGWQADPMFTNKWTSNPCPYGFLFALCTEAVCALGGGSFGWTVLLFKLFILLQLAGVSLLIIAVGRRLQLQRLDLPFYLFLWNPLVILHEIANGHNDLLIAFFVLLAVYMATRQWWVLMVPALTAGFAVKYADFALMPFALILIGKRRGLGTAALAIAASGALIALMAAPYGSGLWQFRAAAIAKNLTSSGASLHSSLFTAFKAIAWLVPPLGAHLALADAIFKLLPWSIAAGLIAVQVWQFARSTPAADDFILVSAFTLFVIICLGSSKFQPWYMCMVLPLAVMLNEECWLKRLIVIISLLELYELTLIGLVKILDYVIPVVIPALYAGRKDWQTIKANLAGQWNLGGCRPLSNHATATIVAPL